MTRARRSKGYARALVSRDFLRYLGPGFIITVGFIDPGNWATNLAAGSRFGYELLWVVTLSTIMLIIFQNMSARIGMATGHSLAYNVRRRFSKPWVGLFGGSIVVACIATDIAEILGGALGFNLLFGLPLPVGGVLTLVLKVGLVATGRYHRIERLIVVFLAIIAACYAAEIFMVGPDWALAARSAVVPQISGESILVAMGVLGAVVMPHNIYLHSNVILSRDWEGDEQTRRRLMTYEYGDTALAMGLGWLVNCAMIVVAAAVFYRHGVDGRQHRAGIGDPRAARGFSRPFALRHRALAGRIGFEHHLVHGRSERLDRVSGQVGGSAEPILPDESVRAGAAGAGRHHGPRGPVLQCCCSARWS